MECRNIHAYIRHRYAEEGIARRRPYLRQNDERVRSSRNDASPRPSSSASAKMRRTAKLAETRETHGANFADAERAGQRKTRTGRAKAGAKPVALAALLVIALALGGGAAFKGVGGAFSHMTGTAESGEVSTPVSQWRRGTTPMLFQTDPAWSDDPYAGATVGVSGCGPTCMTAAYVCQTGRTNFDPSGMARFAQERGFVESGLTTWAFMTEGAKDLGLSSKELPASPQAMASALAEGDSVIASVGPGDFTSQGHFIVITRCNGDGTFSVMDPNSAERSAQTWDGDRIIAQCRNIWAISG